MKSQDRGDSCRLLKLRGWRTASLPRRRSPVRTRCSAPYGPESIGEVLGIRGHGLSAAKATVRGPTLPIQFKPKTMREQVVGLVVRCGARTFSAGVAHAGHMIALSGRRGLRPLRGAARRGDA